MNNNAHFPCDGSNHRAAERAQHDLSKDYGQELTRVYGSPVAKVVQMGTTQYKADNKIHLTDGHTYYASLKLKKNLRNGSFDWINTTNPLFEDVFKDANEIYRQGKDSGNPALKEPLVEAIDRGWRHLSPSQVTELVERHVIRPYTDEHCEILIMDKSHRTLYRIDPTKTNFFRYIHGGGALELRCGARGGKMSRQIVGIGLNGVEISFGLRVRYHLNNGYGAWHHGSGPRANSSSYLCFKVQQDNVLGFLKQNEASFLGGTELPH